MSDDLIGRLAIPGYAIERELGGGGMSRVFLAREVALARPVAIKVLEGGGARVDVERFRREILLAAQLSHPHIVPLLTAGEVDGLLYYIMPYVEGQSLRSRLREAERLPIGEVVRLLRNVGSALAAAHARGVVHRDIKPDNIIVIGGVAVVLDFGVSKALAVSATVPADGLTGAGLAIGTPRYMAPEQVVADPDIDVRADIYALGVLAYEMLTGAPPFVGTDPVKIVRAHLTETPAPVSSRRPDIPPVVAAMVMRCLEKHRERRPASATEVLDLLDAAATPSLVASTSLGAAASRGVAWATAALLPALVYLAAAGIMLAGLRWLASQGHIGTRLVVFSVILALLGLPVVVGVGLLLGVRRAERGY
ncbi:MAG TPA: serine/threonine-protein kinase [Gemmatimonadales bacterium]|nr:serine/threonine-protein kinase [Gemmatimonadales bacterium]